MEAAARMLRHLYLFDHENISLTLLGPYASHTDIDLFSCLACRLNKKNQIDSSIHSKQWLLAIAFKETQCLRLLEYLNS